MFINCMNTPMKQNKLFGAALSVEGNFENFDEKKANSTLLRICYLYLLTILY